MKSFQIYTGFITLLYMLMSANSMFADTVNMEFKEENSINWYNPEKYKDYAEIDDKYNIFNFSKYITEWQPEVKDYRVMIGNDPNYIQVLYKINSYFAVEKKDDITDKQIYLAIVENLDFETSEVSVYTEQNGKTTVGFSDDIILNEDLANEICRILVEKSYIENGLFRPSYYNSATVELGNSYPLEYSSEIADILLNYNIDALVNINENEQFCWISYNYSRSASELIELYNLIYENIEIKPLRFYLPDLPSQTRSPSVATINFQNKLNFGDVNNDGLVDISDLSEISLAILGDKSFTEAQKKAADVDGDGEMTLADLAKFKQFLSKITEKLV